MRGVRSVTAVYLTLAVCFRHRLGWKYRDRWGINIIAKRLLNFHPAWYGDGVVLWRVGECYALSTG